MARADNDCQHAGLASEQARTAQRELCTTARAIADADALVRCEQAERSADSIALQAGRRCELGVKGAGLVMEER